MMTLDIQTRPAGDSLANRAMRALSRRSLTVQFAAYESGNAIAAIAGSGGFARFGADIRHLSTIAAAHPVRALQEALSHHPDLAVVLGVGAVAVLGPLLRSPLRGAAGLILDAVLTVLALSILIYALTQDATWITRAAASFVVGSALLKLAARRPVFLKLGGLALALGGVLLALHGAQMPGGAIWPAVLAGLTVMTGLYVAIAGMLTYEGGIFACAGDPRPSGEDAADRLWHSKHGAASHLLERFVDRPVQGFNRLARHTALAGLPANLCATRPFETSMWARLPWRLVTAAAAVAGGAWAFALANATWALGDLAIGALDWAEPDAPQ